MSWGRWSAPLVCMHGTWHMAHLALQSWANRQLLNSAGGNLKGSTMHHRRQAHHLSAAKDQGAASWVDMPEHLREESASEDSSPRRQSTDGEEHDMGEGWVESITGLKEGDGATDLLINGSKKAAPSKVGAW